VENFFENAPKFKSSQQNNRISAAFLKQMLCATSMSSKYLFKSNLKNKITKQESRGRILNFSEILNFSTGSKEPSSQTFNTVLIEVVLSSRLSWLHLVPTSVTYIV
jgi:hypothetical protein